jgi:predicted nucleic acid-binding protein
MDSSGWVEIVRATGRYEVFREHIRHAESVIVPTLVVYEVYRVIEQEFSAVEADWIAAHFRSHRIVDLTEALAIAAAKLGREHRLATADAAIYATAREFGAMLVTGDNHFIGLPDVAYVPAEIEAPQ